MTRFRLGFVITIFIFLGLATIGAVFAQAPTPEAIPNQACLACHSNPALKYTFPTGEEWPLYVDEAAFKTSVHGQKGLACVGCHPASGQYPHPKVSVRSVREYQLAQYKVCNDCHAQVYKTEMDSIHGRQLAAGNTQAPICTDCHHAHDTTPPNKPRTKLSLACSKCHAQVYQKYLTSVHGKALVEEHNTDVPDCGYCHGVHNPQETHTNAFRLHSPQLCAACHDNDDLMRKYNISTAVFDTYVADFHGSTTTLFARLSPDAATNKPVCYDCHGVHDMQKINDANPQVVQSIMLRTCQKCHPTATTNFPSSWLSHYEPNPNKYPLVYFVNLFYTILIPAVLGAMALYVIIDFGSRWIRRLAGQKQKHEEGG